MAKYFFPLLILMTLSACSLFEKILESRPSTKTRQCCYINAPKDTIFFNCKKQKTMKMEVLIKHKWSNNGLLYWDTIIPNKQEIPVSFIYDKILKDSLLNKYFHIIVRSNKKSHTKSDYWFILDSADLKSGEIIFSYNKVGR